MNVFTLIFALFTLILYAYLFVLRKELLFIAKRKSATSVVLPIILAVFVGSAYLTSDTFDEQVRGFVAVLLVLSYLINGRGIADDRFVLHALDNRGIKFQEVDRVVLFQDSTENVIKLNFFRHGLRGPLMKFNTTTEKLVSYLATRLNQGTPIDVIIDQGNQKS